ELARVRTDRLAAARALDRLDGLEHGAQRALHVRVERRKPLGVAQPAPDDLVLGRELLRRDSPADEYAHELERRRKIVVWQHGLDVAGRGGGGCLRGGARRRLVLVMRVAMPMATRL